MKKKNEIISYLEAFHDEVTGSSFLLTIKYPDGDSYHILIDCGLFQEPEYLRLNYKSEIRVENIDAILITHNHIDHTGGLPKLVKLGYRNPIYMTSSTKSLIPSFLADSANHQASTITEIQKKYPDEKFNIPYTILDVEETINLIQGIPFSKTIEILPGVCITFFPNGHLLGASVILVQISFYGAKDVNFLFTGDYKKNNTFFDVPALPKWVRNLPISIITESTYGTTKPEDIKKTFDHNILTAVELKQNIMIGAFAQGRMQEILWKIKLLQDSYPEKFENYEILLDGHLGIETCSIYRRIMFSSYCYHKDENIDVSFYPRNLRIVSKQERNSIFSSSSTKKIVITTSGMLSHGPALTYVPMFIQKENSLIHLTGYAAEGTLARKLIDSSESNDSEVEINGELLQLKSTIKWTNEFSSHSNSIELIDFLKQFNNLKFVIINHGEKKVKESFKALAINSGISNVEIIDRNTVFVIGHYGFLKSMNSKKTCFNLPKNHRDATKKYEPCPKRKCKRERIRRKK